MKEDKKYLEELFYYIANSYGQLEKNIYEAVNMYQDNPTEEMAVLIADVCNHGKRQLSILLDMLPRICSGELLSKYQRKFEEKSKELQEVKKNIVKQLSK